MKSLRRRAAVELQLKPRSRVLDAGCGPRGTFPYLVDRVGPHGEVIGIEISPESATNARRRIQANHWNNVQVIECDAKTIKLTGMFDGLVMFAAPDVYASPEAVANLLPHLKDDARVVVWCQAF
jgi:tRNA A58 N-methylase Trm61